jgi:hypothetical protein
MFGSIGVMENWSIGKTISGCQVFQEPSLSNASICDQAVLPKLHHSSTPLLHKPLKFQETKSPLGMTKAGSSGPGFLLSLDNPLIIKFIQKQLSLLWKSTEFHWRG